MNRLMEAMKIVLCVWFGALMVLAWTPACAFDNPDQNERFTDPPVNKVVVRKDHDTGKLDVFVAVDAPIWVPASGEGFSTNNDDVYDYDR